MVHVASVIMLPDWCVMIRELKLEVLDVQLGIVSDVVVPLNPSLNLTAIGQSHLHVIHLIG
jgi:hypothetical protein